MQSLTHGCIQVLLRALEHTSDTQEKSNIAIQISMIRNPHIEIVTALEKKIHDQSLKTDGLILAFGALASNAQPDVEQEVTRFLLELQKGLTPTDKMLTTLILAMGNTGSELVVNTVLKYSNNPLDSVQLASLRACLKFTHFLQILNGLKEVLVADPTEEVVTMIVHTLVKGYHYSQEKDMDTGLVANHPILPSLVLAVQRVNNTDLQILVSDYLQLVGGEQAFSLMTSIHSRQRRGSDWDASNTEYNLVASQLSRQSDVNTYPNHEAYIYGKTLGMDEVNLKAAAGTFMGYSSNLENIKGYGKMYAECNVLDIQRTLANIEVLFQKNGVNIQGKVYVEIGGNVLENQEGQLTTCYNYERNLYENRYRLLTFTHSVFVYVTSVGIEVSVYLELTVDIDAEICGGASLDELTTVTAGIAPRVTFSVEGSVSASLLVS